MTYWVWVFAEIQALRWVVDSSTMAFPESAGSRIAAMAKGDQVVLYTTRGAFHNPTRDEARLVGIATVEEDPERRSPPLEIAGREFVYACRVSIDILLPERTGASVRELASDLDLVAKPASWGAYFRQPPVRIGERDFNQMRVAVESLAELEGRA